MNSVVASQAGEAIVPRVDPFALAADRLAAERPLSGKQLQEIERSIGEGRLAFAEKALTGYLAAQPGDADALFLMARTQLRLGHQNRAVLLLGRCIEHAPDFTAARFNYADLLHRTKDFAAGLAQTTKLLAKDPANPLFRQLCSDILHSLGELQQSLAILAELACENPGRAESWLAYGHALRAMGRTEESIGAYRRAVAIGTSCGKAYWALANMKTVPFDDADIEDMQRHLKRGDISADDRIPLQYALGKAYEDRGQYGRSFEQYAKGNAAARLRLPYDAGNVTRHAAAAMALFTPQFLASRKGYGCDAADPIFVVGLPRSGSTLIEQILSSHSTVEGMEELPYITALARRLEAHDYPKSVEDLGGRAFEDLGKEYLQSAAAHRKLGRPFFVDKKPPNWFHIGLIHLILPNAKIIDARRHPAACCFSQFRQYFRKARPRQAELGQLYRDYVQLMAHFDRVLPGKIHRVVYERMVAEPEIEVRGLLNFLGLPFEDACLRFYETKRSVSTPSSEQVRKPISADAVDHWRNYEPWLKPLIDSLGSVLAAYPDVPPELR